MKCVTLLTDFGTRDPYVGVMKGQILKGCPQARMVDLTHEVPPQNVVSAAFMVAKNYHWFPAGTVHLVVVDPGVGSSRAAAAAQVGDHYFVFPDNGVLQWVLERTPEYRAVALPVPQSASSTFHGRDVFAPAAGRLAAGADLDELGPELKELVSLEELPEPSEVVWVDHFGNLITRVGRRGDLKGVEIDGVEVPLRATYTEVERGQPLALWGSDDQLEISVREGSAAEYFRGRRVTLLLH